MPLKGKASDGWTTSLVIYPKEIIGHIHKDARGTNAIRAKIGAQELAK